VALFALHKFHSLFHVFHSGQCLDTICLAADYPHEAQKTL